MKKNVCLSILMVLIMVLSTTIPIMATPDRERDPNGSGVEQNVDQLIDIVYIDGARYYSGRIEIVVFYTESGEVVSREYFDVLLPEEEFTTQYSAIQPFDIMPRTPVHLPPRTNPTRFETVGIVLSKHHLLTHTRTVNYYSGPSLVWVAARTQVTQNQLGAAHLRPGQSFSITVPFNTFSYEINALNETIVGGTGEFSVTR